MEDREAIDLSVSLLECCEICGFEENAENVNKHKHSAHSAVIERKRLLDAFQNEGKHLFLYLNICIYSITRKLIF